MPNKWTFQIKPIAGLLARYVGDGKGWVDHIRKKGNEANHEIVIMKKGDALDLITFIEMLLKFIYEFPSRIPPKPSEPKQ